MKVSWFLLDESEFVVFGVTYSRYPATLHVFD